MENTDGEIPQLAVETENIRGPSVPRLSTEIERPILTETAASTKIQEPTLMQESTALEEIDSDIIKTDPEFGSMETIPLERSTKDLIFDISNEKVENAGDTSLQHSDSASNNLSKYFNVDSSEEVNKDPEGISFFNALSENPIQPKEDILFSMEQPNIAIESQQNIHQQETTNTNNDKEAGDKIEDGNPPPILLKFFTEDKSGKDMDGKAFFDKIAEDTSPGSFPPLQINEPILNMPATEYFLTSPTSNSEIEEAWIPSEKTRQALVSIITSNAAFAPEKSDLTMPGVIIEEEMADPVKALLIEFNSPFVQQRKVLTANDVSEDETGLQKLMENQCYHAALNMTKRLLKSCGQGPGCDGKPSTHTPLSLRLWYTRLALFVKLRKFSLAEVESAVFGNLDKPDLYYEYYPDIYKGKRGTMAPFALRLLLAELPQYQGSNQTALDNMYGILNVIQKMLRNVQNGCAEDGSMIELPDARKAASLEIWRKRERRTLFSILNCVLNQKDYILAVSIAKILIEKSDVDAAQLHSALGRIYLQLGDVHYAEICFKEAIDIAEKKSQDFKVEENINNALLAVACDDNEKAFQYFEQAYNLKPDPMLVNNMAVCKLYTGQLKEALQLLESTIQNTPSSCLHDGLLFNVCTLYELESSRCPQKKLGMLELVSKYAGDSFNVSCLKIQSVKA